VATGLVTGLLFGLAPALRAALADGSDALKLGRSATALARGRGRAVLVTAEVAVTLVLLVAGGLLLQTLYQLRYADLGFRPDSLLSFRTKLPEPKYEVPEKRWAFYAGVLDRVGRLPGVVSAGYTTSVPLEWKGGTSGFRIEGVEPRPGESYDATHRQVSRDYLQTMGIPLRHGRFFEATDDARAQPAVIVNQAMARRYWGQDDVVGKRIRIGRGDEAPWRTIVGVVGDVRQMGLDAPVKPEMYLPLEQVPGQPWFTPRDLVVRTKAGRAASSTRCAGRSATSTRISRSRTSARWTRSWTRRSRRAGSARCSSGSSRRSPSSWRASGSTACFRSTSPSARRRSASGSRSARPGATSSRSWSGAAWGRRCSASCSAQRAPSRRAACWRSCSTAWAERTRARSPRLPRCWPCSRSSPAGCPPDAP
jgi:hypothetical protein